MFANNIYIAYIRIWILLFAVTLSSGSVKADTLPVEQASSYLAKSLSDAKLKDLLKKGNDYLLRNNKPDSAAIYYSIVIQRYNDHKLLTSEDLEYAISAMASLEYINIYYNHNYRNAIAYIIESQHVAEHIGARHRLPEIFIAIGDLHAILFNLSAASTADSKCARKALHYFKQAYNISSEQKMWPQAVVALTNLLQIADDFGVVDSISSEMQHFRKLQIPDSIQLYKFTRLLCDATIAKHKGNYEKAMECYQAMTQAIDTDQARGRCQLIIDIDKAKLYGCMGEYEKEYNCYRDLLPWAQENDASEILVDAYKAFAEYHKRKGNNAEAERYQLLYLQNKDSLMNISHAADIEYMQLLSDWNDREAEIVSWSSKNEQQQTMIIIAIIVAVILLIGCAFLALRYSKLHKKYSSLYEQNLKILSDVELERQSLAKKQTETKAAQPDKNVVQEAEESNVQQNTNETNDNSDLQIRIRQVLELNNEIFSPDFSVRRLAEIVGEKYWLVSQVINDEWGKNFNAVLAQYRILEACRRINDMENYGHLTIEGIAQSVGIKSRSNFSSTFKTIVGMPPSEYQKLASNKKS